MRMPRINAGIVVAIIALVAAMTGTAVATTSVVRLAGKNADNVARVDDSGALKVGDGSGALTVNGTVGTRPLPPSKAWSEQGGANGNGARFRIHAASNGLTLTNLTINNVGTATTTVRVSLDAGPMVADHHLLTLKVLPGQAVSLPFAQGFDFTGSDGDEVSLWVSSTGAELAFMATGYDH